MYWYNIGTSQILKTKVMKNLFKSSFLTFTIFILVSAYNTDTRDTQNVRFCDHV